jgi:putative ABC transport system permease protein
VRTPDLLRLSLEALAAHRLRYGLSALAVAVGVSAVVLMVALGEGARRFVNDQINAFGTAIVGVHAGKVTTAGIPGVGGGARRLTIADARALARVPGVVAATAYTYGSALVEGGERRRHAMIQGVTAEMPRVWSLPVAQGSFLPEQDWDAGGSLAVLGPKLARELFGAAPAVGQRVRIAGRSFRVIGVMRSKGTFLGFDLDDTAYIPVATALVMLNRPELTEVDLLAVSVDDVDAISRRATEVIVDRHGADDVTIVNQRDAMRMAGNVMDVLTGVVVAIAGISLLVGAIGILTILWIVVTERTGEVGLVRALGGTRAQVVTWYLCEAALTAGAGGVTGLLLGALGAAAISRAVPGLEARVPPGIVVAAIAMAVSVGLLAGVVPALRAARLDPVDALRAE